MNRRTPRRIRRLVTLLAMVVVALASVGGAAAPAGAVDHPGLVPDIPTSGYPVILHENQYDTFAANQIGNFIVSGGDFQHVELPDGSVVDQPYFAAWHIDTKELVCDDVVFDDEVLDIIPADSPNSMFVAGRFNTITDADGVQHTRRKIAKLHLPDCRVDLDFEVLWTNAKINAIALTGDRLFLGGDFTQINGQSLARLAEVDATTGALNTFDVGVSSNSTSTFRGIGISPDGERLIAGGRWSSISGVATGPSAVIDISTPGAPVLTGHTSTGTPVTQDLQDAAVSPDGQHIALVYGTATVSDYVVLFSTAGSPQTPIWSHFMRDSNFSVAISDEAVYVGGHFCKIDAGPGPTDVMAPNGVSFCTGVFYAGGAWRTQLAALDIATGTPLTWNPGNDAGRGARELRVTDRGLLVGYDGDRTNSFRVGTTASFDFGPTGDTLPPSTATILEPAPNGTVASPFKVRATATDNVAVTAYEFRARHANGQWLQSDGSLGTDPVLFATTADADGDLDVDVVADVLGDYTLQVRAGDAADNLSLEWDDATITIATQAPTACVATVHADGDVVVSWDPIAGVDTYQLRRNGSWIGSTSDTVFLTTGSMADSFVVRHWTGGVIHDSPCQNIDGGPGVACVAAIGASGDALLDWDAVPGVDEYQVRRDGSWLATTTATTYTDTTTVAGANHTYVVRWWLNQTSDQHDCETVGGVADPTCTVTELNGGGIRIDWDEISGVAEYFVRKNGSWLATTGSTTHTDLTGTTADTYAVRHWSGGLTELTCA